MVRRKKRLPEHICINEVFQCCRDLTGRDDKFYENMLVLVFKFMLLLISLTFPLVSCLYSWGAQPAAVGKNLYAAVHL